MKSLRARHLLVPGLLLLVPAISVAMSHPSNHVVANGGLTASGSGRVLNGTLGQAVVGTSLGPGHVLAHGYWTVVAAPTTGVDPVPVPPRELRITPPQPNPARGAVRFGVNLPGASRVGVAVFDVAGREVGERLERSLEAGVHSFEWRAPTGRSGVFFARFVVNGRLADVRRIVLVE